MSLIKWIQVEKHVLPSSSMRAYSSLSKKDLDNANKEVKRAREVEKNEKIATPMIMPCIVALCACTHDQQVAKFTIYQ